MIIGEAPGEGEDKSGHPFFGRAGQVLNSLLGDSALVRFDRDVLGQAAVKYVILLEGINDIGLGNPDVTADQVIAGYGELIDRAHASGLKIFGGTLTPAEGNPYPFYKPYDESKRQAINQFIRESGAFDAVLDFAAAVSDPADPSHWRAGLSADALHPSDAGAEVMGDAIDLSLFQSAPDAATRPRRTDLSAAPSGPSTGASGSGQHLRPRAH